MLIDKSIDVRLYECIKVNIHEISQLKEIIKKS
jgi:hypothetical protein